MDLKESAEILRLLTQIELEELEYRKTYVIARHRGNKVRWRNKETGRWEKGWWALFVTVPKDALIIGLTTDEFNDLAGREGWPGR